MEEIIDNKKLEELYNACGGKLSHYVFLDNEPAEYVKTLVENGYIKYVKNSEKRQMYIAKVKLIRLFRELYDHEGAQIKAGNKAKAEAALIEAEELANAGKQILQQ